MLICQRKVKQGAANRGAKWSGLSENAAGIFGNNASGGQFDNKMFYFILLQRFMYCSMGYDSVFCTFSRNNLKIKNTKCAKRAVELLYFNPES